MTPPKNKHLSTLAIAKAAMGQIATHGQAADPRSYELWYKFATGDSRGTASVNGGIRS